MAHARVGVGRSLKNVVEVKEKARRLNHIFEILQFDYVIVFTSLKFQHILVQVKKLHNTNRALMDNAFRLHIHLES